MPFEYQTNLDAIITALKNHNTTTASPYLSLSMGAAILDENIVSTDPEIVNMRADRMPAIFVRLQKRSDNFASIGAVGSSANRVKKQADVVYDVIGFFTKQGARDSYENLLKEIYTMSRNIEGVINEEYTLGGTALWAQPLSTEFFPPMEISGSWVKSVLIQIQARYLYK